MSNRCYSVLTAYLVLIALLLVSCDTGWSDTLAPTPDTPPPVSYLNETIPPCSSSGTLGQDPCPSGPPAQVDTLSVAAHQTQLREVPNLTNKLLGTDTPGIAVPHIVVRGTVRADTTRCELYSMKFPDYSETSIDISEYFDYYCFIDLVVSEYLVGQGPSRLTIGMHREVIWLVEDWADVKDSWITILSDPRKRTATAYEGKELVLFLQATGSISVEAWEPVGLFNIWFVQQTDDGIRAVAQEMDLAQTPEIRDALDLSLTELETQIRTAAAARTNHITKLSSETTGTEPPPTGTARVKGGLGNLKPVPLIVTDANHLRNFYEAVGAVYEGDDATVVPPVVVPGVPRNVAVSESWVVSWDPPDRGGEAHWYRIELRFTSRRVLLFSGYQAQSANIAPFVSRYLGEDLELRVRAENFTSGRGEWTDALSFTNIASTAPTTSSSTTTTAAS